VKRNKNSSAITTAQPNEECEIFHKNKNIFIYFGCFAMDTKKGGGYLMAGRVSGPGDNNSGNFRFPREEQKHSDLTRLFIQIKDASSLDGLQAYEKSFQIIKPEYYKKSLDESKYKDIPQQIRENIQLCRDIEGFIKRKRDELSGSNGFFSWAKSLFFSKKSPPPPPEDFEKEEPPPESIDFNEDSETMLDKQEVLSGFREYEKDQQLLSNWLHLEQTLITKITYIEKFETAYEFRQLETTISQLKFSNHTPSYVIKKLVSMPLLLWACNLSSLTNIFVSWSSLQDPAARSKAGLVMDFIGILETKLFAENLAPKKKQLFIQELLREGVISQQEFEKIKAHFSSWEWPTT
jgi:hypothetical protein